MDYYFIEVGVHGRVTCEQHKRGNFKVSNNIKTTRDAAKKEYVKQLKTIAKELNDAIMYIEQAKVDYIPPVLLRSIHGVSNTDIDLDNEYNTSTFGEL